MKEKLTKYEHALVSKHWKTGFIDFMREIVSNKERLKKKLVRLDILRHLKDEKYEINREAYIKYQDSEDIQGKLF